MTEPVVRFTVRGDPQPVGSSFGASGREYIVVYDGFCGICQRLARKLAHWDRDRRLEIVPSQSPGVQARFPWIPTRAYTESLQLVRADGRTWQGAAAIEELLRAVPRGRFISWIFSIPFVRPLAERCYRWFARRRYKLGCGEHCQVKPADLRFEREPVPYLPP